MTAQKCAGTLTLSPENYAILAVSHSAQACVRVKEVLFP